MMESASTCANLCVDLCQPVRGGAVRRRSSSGVEEERLKGEEGAVVSRRRRGGEERRENILTMNLSFQNLSFRGKLLR